MTALLVLVLVLVLVLLILAVAGVLLAALHHRPNRQETTMPRKTSPDFQPPVMALDALPFEDIGDRGTCTTRGRHEHRWWRVEERDGETVKLGIIVPVGPSGVVMLSEGSVEEILTAAGFTRSDR